MDAAVAGLIGAIIGVFGGIASALTNNYFQGNLETQKWVRIKREEAYVNTVRNLRLAVNRGRFLVEKNDGQEYKQDFEKMFDNLTEAQAWMASLTIYCSKNSQTNIYKYFKKLEGIVLYMKESKLSKNDLVNSMDEVCKNVTESAREDIGKEIKR